MQRLVRMCVETSHTLYMYMYIYIRRPHCINSSYNLLAVPTTCRVGGAACHMTSSRGHLISDGAAGEVEGAETRQLSQELHSRVRDVLAVAEGEVGEREAGGGESEERDVAQFRAVGQIQLLQL